MEIGIAERTIVTGASNVKVVALSGAVLVDGKQIERAVLRGAVGRNALFCRNSMDEKTRTKMNLYSMIPSRNKTVELNLFTLF